MRDMIKNPIIPGYYPDPSICRVGDDFYLACSSFEMWPGIPVFHSRDLVHWEQIANAMTAENGFYMEKGCGAGGVMAPTIRYNNGLFYIINTNFADRGNYIITAEDPRGPWSEPHWLTDVPGIDASLFFDDDGQAYVIGTGNVWDNGAGQKERGFWLAKYDVENYRMLGEPVTIFNSALRVGASPEAPHIYHIGEYYYLIFAEGGTEHHHAVMAARSKTLFGFYEGNPANPVMTHRHMGYTCPIINVGHADLIDLPDGSWYAVMLASRLIDKEYKNLGRETFICPVVWERDWPLFSSDTGKVEWTYEAPASLPETKYLPEETFDDFEEDALRLYWTLWGTPGENVYKLHDSVVSLRCVPQILDDEMRSMRSDGKKHPERFAAFLARRQKEIRTTATCSMHFVPSGNEKAGLAVMQSMNHQLHIEQTAQALRVIVITSEYNRPPYMPGFEGHTNRRVVAEIPWQKENTVLQIEMNGEDWIVRYGCDQNELQDLVSVNGAEINPEKVGCMCGTLIGMFATGNGTDSQNTADFDWFELV